MKTHIGILAAILSLGLGLSACDGGKNSLDDATDSRKGEAMKDAVEDVGDAMEDAADDVEDKFE